MNHAKIYFMFHYIHVHHHTIILNQHGSLGKHQTSKSQHCLAQHLAQAEGSRSGETCSLRRASPSPRRERQKQGHGQHGISLKRDPSLLGELPARSKVERAAWATFRAKNLGELPVSSRLGEMERLGEINRSRHCSSLHSHVLHPNYSCKAL